MSQTEMTLNCVERAIKLLYDEAEARNFDPPVSTTAMVELEHAALLLKVKS